MESSSGAYSMLRPSVVVPNREVYRSEEKQEASVRSDMGGVVAQRLTLDLINSEVPRRQEAMCSVVLASVPRMYTECFNVEGVNEVMNLFIQRKLACFHVVCCCSMYSRCNLQVNGQ